MPHQLVDRSFLLRLLTLTAVASCSTAPPSATVGGSQRNNEDEACEEGATESCSCDQGEGERLCSEGVYGECDCSESEDTGDGDDDQDNEVDDNTAKCKAGYYVGTFKGDWKPGIGDIPPFGTLIDVTITASDQPDKPGLALTLEEKLDGSGQEFVSYEVKNGCLVGTASSGDGQNHPFIGTITGSLRCDTGEFEGHVEGYYHLFGELLDGLSVWNFAGSMTGQFDVAAAGIEDGMWDLRETQSTAPNGPGGKAMWQAAWQSEEGPELPPECKMLLEEQANDEPEADGGV